MGTSYNPREVQRQKAVTKIVQAHSLVLDEWPNDRVERLSDEVRTEPLYRPVSPTDVEQEFLSEVRQRRSEVEVEPVKMYPVWQPSGVIVGWVAAGND